MKENVSNEAKSKISNKNFSMKIPEGYLINGFNSDIKSLKEASISSFLIPN